MDLLISYIGFAHAIIAVFLIYTRIPQQIPYKILSSLLLVYAVMFGLDILSGYHLIPTNRWFFSLSLTMLFPPLFYLYAKYITKVYSSFNKLDFLHFIPSALLILIFFVLKITPTNTTISGVELYEKHYGLKIGYGFIFNVQLIYYSVRSLKTVVRFKRQMKHYYSFNSYKVSLNWLSIMIVLFLLFHVIIVISSTFIEINSMQSSMLTGRLVVKLFFVYIISLWGFNQNQLNSEVHEESIKNTDEEAKDASTFKYKKSGLKSEDVEKYIQTVVQFMDESEVWKDTELSISKLALQTSIPKHYLSEVLNEHLGKTFYGFVNEYRIEYAKKLLKSDKYKNWSILAIAYECGFNSKAVFNSFFKKHTQLTPSEYKKKFEFEI